MNPGLDFATLHRLYVVQKMSYSQIAKRQGVEKAAVAHALKRGAKKRGMAWPLRAPIRNSNWDTVASCGVAEYIRDLRRQGIPYTEFAKAAKTHPSVIWELVAPNPRRNVMLRSKAEHFMRVVSAFEKQLAEEREASAA